MKRFVLCLTLVLTLMSFSMTALAASDSFSGTIEAQGSTGVFAPIGGTVKTVNVTAGQQVKIGDVLYTLNTDKVYAEQAGTIEYVFGLEGDSVTSLDSLYGGVLFMKPVADYTISASTSKAYDDDANRVIAVGEMVYLRCYSDNAHTGIGMVTAVSGSSYTVKVTQGIFEINETVVIYRDSAYTNASRLGRGTVAKTDPIAVTGTGSIVKMHVNAGDQVQKGDLLFETLTGEFEGMVSSSSEIKSNVDGVVASVNVSVGGTVTKGEAAVTVYENKNLWIAVTVPEADLDLLKAGDAVEVEFNWKDGLKTQGVVGWISSTGEVDSSTSVTNYTAYVTFEPDTNTRLGLNVTVQTLETVTP